MEDKLKKFYEYLRMVYTGNQITIDRHLTKIKLGVETNYPQMWLLRSTWEYGSVNINYCGEILDTKLDFESGIVPYSMI